MKSYTSLETQTEKDRVRFPIALKLTGIIIPLLFLALTIIIFLSSILISDDVRITAEDNNFNINRRLASSVVSDDLFGLMAAKTNDFLNSISQTKKAQTASLVQLSETFFSKNKNIAAVVVHDALQPSSGFDAFINTDLWAENNFDIASSDVLVDRLIFLQQDKILSCQTTNMPLLESTDVFQSTNLLVLIYPTSFEGKNQTVLICFSPRDMAELFSSGDSLSFLVNSAGKILLSPNTAYTNNDLLAALPDFVSEIFSDTEGAKNVILKDANNNEYLVAYQKNSRLQCALVTVRAKSEVFTELKKIFLENIIAGAVALLICSICIILLARNLSRPLKKLNYCIAGIEVGNYNIPIDIKRNDEIGLLAESLTGMRNGVANFEKFANKTILRLAREGKLKREGVNRTGTVAFFFIRDFDKICKDFSAEQTVEFINEFSKNIVPCISATGGIIDKFLTQGGVILMALWGVCETKGSAKDDAYDCIKSALMMRSAVREFNKCRMQEERQLVKMGAGINYGELVVGQIGSDERMEYTVIGDAVNLAARLEGPNDAFDTDILISLELKNLLGALIETEEMPSLSVKGKKDPLRVFAVLNITEDGGPHSMEEVRKLWVPTNE
ncbi:MAG: adenylate/guanylate cyclase domain-containing protein [Termitinemataceae bacterium]|nr:MAG: adenylate/guanylate cyclase domain-containing protein [Termitinemataceae bacterium]